MHTLRYFLGYIRMSKMASGGKTPMQWVDQGDDDLQKQNYDAALDAYEEALRLTSTNTSTHSAGAPILGRFKVSSQSPDVKVRAIFGKGEALRMLKHYEESIAAYEQAIQFDSKNDYVYLAYIGKSSALRGRKRYDGALKACDEAIQLNPDRTHAYHYKGMALCDLKRYDEALEACRRATQLNSSYTSAYIGKGDALVGLLDYAKALEAYERALELG